MVSAIQSGAQWNSTNAVQGFKQQPLNDVFTLSPTPQSEKNSSFEPFGTDGFTLLDAIDIVNPLQHLPIIGPLYREITGDTLDPASRIAGSSLFFGPFGTAISAVNVTLEEFTGNDMGGHFIAMVKDKDKATVEATTANAEITSPPINPSTTSLNQNTSVDPVTTWAAGEINHRNGEALKQGIDLPTRAYSTLVANAAPTLVETARATTPTLKTNQDEPTTEPAEQTLNQAHASEMPIQHGLLALNAFKKDFQASPTSLLQIKRTADAYQSVSQTKPEPVDQKPAIDPVPKAPEPISSSSQPQTLGSIASNGGWFSASMNDALSKYHDADRSGLLRDKNNVPLASSLH